MNKMKYFIGVFLLFMIVGFATISVTLSINGVAHITNDLDDFNVYFSNVLVDSEEDLSLVKSERELEFDIDFKLLGEEHIISYEVTNGSKMFDAKISVTCTAGDNLLSAENEISTAILTSLSSRIGTLTLKKLRPNSSEDNVSYNVSCTLVATPVERTTTGSGEVPGPISYNVLASTSYTDTSTFRSDTYKTKIKTITFENEIDVPSSTNTVWDLSANEDGSIKAFVTPNVTSGYYDLHIQSNRPIHANEDMSYWFYGFTYLDSITGLELVNTNSMNNMECMFYNAGSESSIFTLDLSTFDTSQVTNMYMTFSRAGYKSNNFELKISNFDTSQVTDMYGLFDGVGYTNPKFTLDVSNFDTSKVTNMYGMFNKTGYNSTEFTLDTSNFDTSQVTNMSRMFYETGYNSTKFVTSLTVSNPETSSYAYMFTNVATKTGAKITINYIDATSSLVDKMISTKSSTSNVVKGSIVS